MQAQPPTKMLRSNESDIASIRGTEQPQIPVETWRREGLHEVIPPPKTEDAAAALSSLDHNESASEPNNSTAVSNVLESDDDIQHGEVSITQGRVEKLELVHNEENAYSDKQIGTVALEMPSEKTMVHNTATLNHQLTDFTPCVVLTRVDVTAPYHSTKPQSLLQHGQCDTLNSSQHIAEHAIDSIPPENVDVVVADVNSQLPFDVEGSADNKSELIANAIIVDGTSKSKSSDDVSTRKESELQVKQLRYENPYGMFIFQG